MGLDTKIEWASAGAWPARHGTRCAPATARTANGAGIAKSLAGLRQLLRRAPEHQDRRERSTGIAYKPGLRPAVEIYLDDKAAWQPLRMGTTRGIFVCSMTDLFGPFVPEIARIVVMANAALCQGHRFLLLTKRSAQMRIWLEDWKARLEAANHGANHPAGPGLNSWSISPSCRTRCRTSGAAPRSRTSAGPTSGCQAAGDQGRRFSSFRTNRCSGRSTCTARCRTGSSSATSRGCARGRRRISGSAA